MIKKTSILASIFLFFILPSIINSTSLNAKLNSKNELNKLPNSSDKKNNKPLEFNVSNEHFPSIGQNERIRFIILHYTAINDNESISVLTKTNVSAHYLVLNDDSKDIQLLVSEDKRAWHAGVSTWGKFNNLNDTSIGIEIVNLGFKLINEKQEFFNFTDNQYEKVAFLCKKIISKYKIKPNYILAHADIAPQRKFDPGPKFSWKRLYKEYDIGAWYEDTDKEYFLKKIGEIKYNSSEILKIQKEFEKYGYKMSLNGIADDKFKRIVTVFQYHFRPENYNGIVDKETYAILLALNKKYN